MEAARPEEATAAATPKEGRAGRSGAYSGRLLLRMPESLHAELAKASQAEGVSLNAFITDVLAGAVGGKESGLRSRGRPRHVTEAAPAATPRRLLPSLLVANLLVVGAVGIVALVLLFQTLL
jgi:RNA polymerase sigma-B factor